MNKKYLLLTLLVVLLILTVTQVHIFEDGSFGVGQFPYLIDGCIPFNLCQ